MKYRALLGSVIAVTLTACGGGGSSDPVTNQGTAPASVDVYPNEITSSYTATVNLQDFWKSFSSMPEYRGFHLFGEVSKNGTTGPLSAILDKRTVIQTKDIFNSIKLRPSQYAPVEIMLWLDKTTLLQSNLFYTADAPYCVAGAKKVTALPGAANVGASGDFLSGEIFPILNNTCGREGAVGDFALTWKIRAFENKSQQICAAGGCESKRLPFFCFESTITKLGQGESTSVCFEVKADNTVGDSTRWFERTAAGFVNLSGSD